MITMMCPGTRTHPLRVCKKIEKEREGGGGGEREGQAELCCVVLPLLTGPSPP
jgi:hypothetical protein